MNFIIKNLILFNPINFGSQDHKVIDKDPSTSIKDKAKEINFQQNNNNSFDSFTFTFVRTELSKQHIILNHSQGFRIYILALVFNAPNFA